MAERSDAYRRAAGATIRALRHARGWSLRDLSQASGISVPYLSEIERGRKDPSGALIGQIAAAFGLSLGALLTEIGRAADAAPADATQQTARQQLWAALGGLTEEELAEVARYARYLRWRRTAEG
ncbi:MAG: helix-turn-helix domain-containing protein [Sphaerobacter sp.]|nr:helix-turn-helix domain-containing protein [Sphaerobacter sp.]